MGKARAKAPLTHYEVVFLHRGKAISGYAPVRVPLEAVQRRRNGLLLTQAVRLDVGKDDAAVELDHVRLQGLGLKRLCTLANPIRVAPGSSVELGANSLLFLE